jgi:DNA-binding response OmpR family regulator
MLTSRSSRDDVITGLETWADDYLVKPFDYDILVARLDALTRRNLKNKSTSLLSIWNYILDLEKIEVREMQPSSFSKGGDSEVDSNQENKLWELIHLSDLEFRLLKYFAQNKWRAIDRQELYEKVWGEFDGDFMFSKTVDVYIGYLRKKLWREIVETKKWHWYIAN